MTGEPDVAGYVPPRAEQLNPGRPESPIPCLVGLGAAVVLAVMGAAAFVALL